MLWFFIILLLKMKLLWCILGYLFYWIPFNKNAFGYTFIRSSYCPLKSAIIHSESNYSSGAVTSHPGNHTKIAEQQKHFHSWVFGDHPVNFEWNRGSFYSCQMPWMLYFIMRKTINLSLNKLWLLTTVFTFNARQLLSWYIRAKASAILLLRNIFNPKPYAEPFSEPQFGEQSAP